MITQSLRHSVGTTGRSDINMHKVHLLRSKIAHFVTSLHAFIMTRILHSYGNLFSIVDLLTYSRLGLEFSEKFGQVQDVDGLLELHEWYSTTVFNRCLLHDKVWLSVSWYLWISDIQGCLATRRN